MIDKQTKRVFHYKNRKKGWRLQTGDYKTQKTQEYRSKIKDKSPRIEIKTQSIAQREASIERSAQSKKD